MSQVSIITPVYNVERYIGACVESVLNQTYENWELLLLDDESSDKSLEICKEYAKKDNRIRLICNKHAGVSAMRNKGIELARGEYITFLDSDDQIAPDFLQRAVKLLWEKQIDIYMAGMQGLENGITVAKGVVKNPIYSDTLILSGKQRIELLEQNYTASCCSKVFSREVIGEIRFEEGCIFGEDLVFMHELLKKNVVIFADNYVGYNYYKHAGSLITTTTIKKCRDIVKIYLFLFETAEGLGVQNRNYFNYIKKRCVLDLQNAQNSILNAEAPFCKKLMMLKILLAEKEIRQVCREVVGKTRLGKYSFSPEIILMKYYIQKILKRK